MMMMMMMMRTRRVTRSKSGSAPTLLSKRFVSISFSSRRRLLFCFGLRRCVIIELKNTLTCKHDSDKIFIQTHCTISFNSFGVISAVNVSIGLLRLRPYFLLQWVTRARPFVYSSISTHCRYSNPPQSLDQYYTNTSISKRYDNSRIQKCDTLTITGFLDPFMSILAGGPT